MIRYRHRRAAAPHPQEQIERLRQAGHARLGRAVRVPPAEGILAGRPDARGHVQPDGVRREISRVWSLGSEGRARGGEERGEVLGEQERGDGVYGEGVCEVLLGELGGGFFRVKDAWEAKGEAEVVGCWWKEGLGLGRRAGDGGFVCLW